MFNKSIKMKRKNELTAVNVFKDSQEKIRSGDVMICVESYNNSLVQWHSKTRWDSSAIPTSKRCREEVDIIWIFNFSIDIEVLVATSGIKVNIFKIIKPLFDMRSKKTKKKHFIEFVTWLLILRKKSYKILRYGESRINS